MGDLLNIESALFSRFSGLFSRFSGFSAALSHSHRSRYQTLGSSWTPSFSLRVHPADQNCSMLLGTRILVCTTRSNVNSRAA